MCAIVDLEATACPLFICLAPQETTDLRHRLLGDDGVVMVGSGALGIVGGVPVLTLDNVGQSRARVQVNQHGSSSLGFFDDHGAQRLVMTVDASSALFMTLHDEGMTRLALGV